MYRITWIDSSKQDEFHHAQTGVERAGEQIGTDGCIISWINKENGVFIMYDEIVAYVMYEEDVVERDLEQELLDIALEDYKMDGRIVRLLKDFNKYLQETDGVKYDLLRYITMVWRR